MPRILPSVMIAAFLLATACSREDRARPRTDVSFDSPRAIVFGNTFTKSERLTTDSTLRKEGFRVRGISSDSTAIFCERTIWDSVGCCFRTENADYYYPTKNGVRMDFLAVYPPSMEITSRGESHYVLTCTDDIVAALKCGVEEQRGPVLLEFRHILSKVRISVSPITDEAKFLIDSILVASPASGRFSFNDFDWKDLSAPVSLTYPTGKDLTVFPGRISVTIRWKCVRNGLTSAEYCRSVDFILQMGRCSHISLILSDDLSSECEFNVTVLPWEDNDVETNFN